MISQSLVHPEPVVRFADLQARLVAYASRIDEFRTSGEVLEALHSTITESLPLSVLGAVRFPVNATAVWSETQLGKSVFLHKDVPDGWWEEHVALSQGRFAPILFLARSSLASLPGLRFNGCSNLLGVIGGLMSWRSSTECATD
jgi:hypothetical protein